MTNPAFFHSKSIIDGRQHIGDRQHSSNGAWGPRLALPESDDSWTGTRPVARADDVIHLFYKDHLHDRLYWRSLNPTGDIFLAIRRHGEAWSRPSGVWDSGNNVAWWIYGNTYTHDGLKRLGFTYTSGPHEDDVGNIYYNEIILPRLKRDLHWLLIKISTFETLPALECAQSLPKPAFLLTRTDGNTNTCPSIRSPDRIPLSADACFHQIVASSAHFLLAADLMKDIGKLAISRPHFLQCRTDNH
jgi:hypothetical protein